MGGYGSGRRRKVTRGTVESVLSVDAQRVLAPGAGWRGTLSWSRRDRLLAQIDVEVAIDHVEFRYRPTPGAPAVRDRGRDARATGESLTEFLR